MPRTGFSPTYLPNEPKFVMNATAERVRRELTDDGYSIVRNLLPPTAIGRARAHLEKCVDKHLAAQVDKGAIADACAGLPFEERMARAYADNPEAAPCSWVPETKHSFAFQQLLFRDASLTALISELTNGREAVVASRYNCRCKLPNATGAAFPWHQDHAFFRMQYLLKKQEPKRLLAAWAPLVTVDAANGGVEYASGSHLRGFRKHQRKGGFLTVVPHETLTWNEPPAEGTGCRRADASAGDGDTAMAIEGSASEMRGVIPTLEPGDVIFFTDLSFHRSGLNASTTARWSADWAYEILPSDPVCPALESTAVEREGTMPPPTTAAAVAFEREETVPPPATTAAVAVADEEQLKAAPIVGGSESGRSRLLLVAAAMAAAGLCAMVVIARAQRHAPR